MKMLTTRSSWMEYRDVLRDLKPFRTYGALRGTQVCADMWETGSLRDHPAWYAQYEAARNDHRLTYVVYSYHTPIAWFEIFPGHVAQGQWVIPDARYSVTTSRHQSKIRAALSALPSPGMRGPNEPSARVTQAVADAMMREVNDRTETAIDAYYRDAPSRHPDIAKRPIPHNSGESAIYSEEYLRRRERKAGRPVGPITPGHVPAS